MLSSAVSNDTACSAQEIVTGRKSDAKRDLRLEFGAYAQVHRAKTSKTMEPRTVGCISLHGTESVAGSWKFYVLATGGTTVRQRWAFLPIPLEVVEHMNSVAATRHEETPNEDDNWTDPDLTLPDALQDNELDTCTYADQAPYEGAPGLQDDNPTSFTSDHGPPPESGIAPLICEAVNYENDIVLDENPSVQPYTMPTISSVSLDTVEDVMVHAVPHWEALDKTPDNDRNDSQIDCSPPPKSLNRLRLGDTGISSSEGIVEEGAARALSENNTQRVQQPDDDLSPLRPTIQVADAHKNSPAPPAINSNEEPSPSRRIRDIDTRLRELGSREQALKREVTRSKIADIDRRLDLLARREEELLKEHDDKEAIHMKRPSKRPAPEDDSNDEPPVVTKRRIEEARRTHKRASEFADREAIKRAKALNLRLRAAVREYGSAALKAIVSEMFQTTKHDKNVMEPAHLASLSSNQRKLIIPSHLLLKKQTWPDGTLKKIKARLVAGGNMQDKKLYPDPASPTAHTDAVLAVATIAAHEGRSVATADFPGAFLHAEMPGDPPTYIQLNRFLSGVFVALVPEAAKYRNQKGEMILSLRRALYGTILAAKLWYDKLTAMLKRMGFKPNAYDPCIWNINRRAGQMTLALHVDDVLITVASENDIDEFLQDVSHNFDNVESHRGRKLNYLGMILDFATRGVLKIRMPGYIDSILEDAGVTTSRPTPADANIFVVTEDADLLHGEKKNAHHSMASRLLYLAKRARPDIFLPVAFLITRVESPTVEDATKLLRVLEYLNLTRDLGLNLEVGHRPIASIDAAFAVHPNMASHTGAAVSLGSGTITAKSSKQKAVVKNSTEAEILAVSDAIGAALWLTNFLREQGHQCDAPVLLQDNQSAIAMMRRGRPHSARARHMHIQHFSVHDLIQRSELQVEHCGTQYMVGDILTKPLQGSQFRRLRDQLLGYQPFHEGNAPTAARPGSVSRNNEGEQVQSSPVHTGVLELGESSEVETATGDRGLLLLDSHPSDYLSHPPSRETVLS